MRTDMTINEVYEYYNQNWCEVSRELKIGVNSYQHWIKIGYIPRPMQVRIELKTNGKLTAVEKEVFNDQGTVRDKT